MSDKTNDVSVPVDQDWMVGTVLRICLVLILALMVLFNVIADVIYYVEIVRGVWAAELLRELVRQNSLYANVSSTFGGPVVQLLPGLITAYCFAKQKPILSGIGRTVFLLDIALIIASGVFLSQSGSEGKLADFPGGIDRYHQLEDIAKSSFGLAWIYLGMLTGLSIPKPKAGDGSNDNGQPAENRARATGPDRAELPSPDAPFSSPSSRQEDQGQAPIGHENTPSVHDVREGQSEVATDTDANNPKRRRPARKAQSVVKDVP